MKDPEQQLNDATQQLGRSLIVRHELLLLTPRVQKEECYRIEHCSNSRIETGVVTQLAERFYALKRPVQKRKWCVQKKTKCAQKNIVVSREGYHQKEKIYIEQVSII